MIRHIPRWIIFEERGGYWVAKRKTGGCMAFAKTIEEAKIKYLKMQEFEFEDDGGGTW